MHCSLSQTKFAIISTNKPIPNSTNSSTCKNSQETPSYAFRKRSILDQNRADQNSINKLKHSNLHNMKENFILFATNKHNSNQFSSN